MGFSEYWGWYLVIDSLSNNDVTKWEYISKMDLISFLNILAFYKDKQNELEAQRALNNMGNG